MCRTVSMPDGSIRCSLFFPESGDLVICFHSVAQSEGGIYRGECRLGEWRREESKTPRNDRKRTHYDASFFVEEIKGYIIVKQDYPTAHSLLTDVHFSSQAADLLIAFLESAFQDPSFQNRIHHLELSSGAVARYIPESTANRVGAAYEGSQRKFHQVGKGSPEDICIREEGMFPHF